MCVCVCILTHFASTFHIDTLMCQIIAIESNVNSLHMFADVRVKRGNFCGRSVDRISFLSQLFSRSYPAYFKTIKTICLNKNNETNHMSCIDLTHTIYKRMQFALYRKKRRKKKRSKARRTTTAHM